ncbi:flagellar hook-length control protein FliK [Sphingomonas pseudosanguinis]|uniref:flagellar hook-length control protein FliK n=1 Tax=Sphingomonas pseudosanguinis TaxID=413712 RepID=UPI003F873E58
MTSAFAMLFALMPGIADAPAPATGEAKAKGDGDAGKDGSTAEDDGKDLPSDAILLPSMPLMPFALPPVVDTPPAATTTLRASTDSPAPIASLLAAMPGLPPVDRGVRGATDPTKPPPSLIAAMPGLPSVDVGVRGATDPVKSSASLVAATTDLPPVNAGTFDDVPAVRPDSGLAQLAAGSSSHIGIASDTGPALTAASPDAKARPDSVIETAPSMPGVRTAPLRSELGDGIALPAGMEAVDATPLSSPTRIAAKSARPGAADNSASPLRTDIASPVALPRIDAATSHPLEAPAPIASAPATPGAPHDDGRAPPLPDARPPAENVGRVSVAPPIDRSADRPVRVTEPMPAPAAPTAMPDQTQPRPVLRADLPARFSIAATPVATPLPVNAPALTIQPGQTAPAMQLFAGLMRAGQQEEGEPLRDRTKTTGPATIDAAGLVASPVMAPVAAPAGPDRAPLDMTQAHWPQAMIERIDRMREDAATADSRIQLSPDALGGIAVAIRREDGATHIHFTAEQAQTATLLAEARPTLAQLAEDKGMRLGQTAVDLGQSGGGERQAPQRQPEPVIPARPAFAGTPSGTETGDQPAGATTRIA